MKNLSVTLTLPQTRWGTRYLMFQLVFLPGLLAQFFRIFFPDAGSTALNIAYFLINFCAVVWIFRGFLWESACKLPKNAGKVLLYAAAGLVAVKTTDHLLGLIIGHFLPEFYNVNDANVTASLRTDQLIFSICAVVLVPLTEECLHRGLVFGMIRQRSRAAAYIVSVLLFCFIHITNYLGYFESLTLFICFIQYIPAGLVFALAYETSGSIFCPILIHMLINTVGILSVR